VPWPYQFVTEKHAHGKRGQDTQHGSVHLDVLWLVKLPDKSVLRADRVPAILWPLCSCIGVAAYYQSEGKEISGQLRLVFGAIGLGLVFLLVIAAALKPSPYHLGTHQQLGLPPCSFLVIFGIPCPTCGMTTAWADLMHGELILAFQANISGVLLAVSAILAAPWLMISAVRGRWLGWKPTGTVVAYVAGMIILISLVQWAYHLLATSFRASFFN
jgi:hypothetical protein